MDMQLNEGIVMFLFPFFFNFDMNKPEYFELDVMCNISYSKHELCGCIIRQMKNIWFQERYYK